MVRKLNTDFKWSVLDPSKRFVETVKQGFLQYIVIDDHN